MNKVSFKAHFGPSMKLYNDKFYQSYYKKDKIEALAEDFEKATSQEKDYALILADHDKTNCFDRFVLVKIEENNPKKNLKILSSFVTQFLVWDEKLNIESLLSIYEILKKKAKSKNTL